MVVHATYSLLTNTEQGVFDRFREYAWLSHQEGVHFSALPTQDGRWVVHMHVPKEWLVTDEKEATRFRFLESDLTSLFKALTGQTWDIGDSPMLPGRCELYCQTDSRAGALGVLETLSHIPGAPEITALRRGEHVKQTGEGEFEVGDGAAISQGFPTHTSIIRSPLLRETEASAQTPRPPGRK